MNFTRHKIDAEGWTDWIRPRQKLYRMRCCDCHLVHDMQFKANFGQVLFRARRNEELTRDSRTKQELKKAAAKTAAQARKAGQIAAEAGSTRTKAPSPRAVQVAAWRKVACPTCGAHPGCYCWTFRAYIKGPTTHVHVSRIAAGKKAQRKRNNVKS